MDETAGENLGGTPSVMDGYNPYQPPPPADPPGAQSISVSITIANGRHGHTLQLRQADGTICPINPAAGYESVDAYLTAWNYFSYNGSYVAIPYFPAHATCNAAQGFSIVDQNTGEEQSFTAGTSSIDLMEWYPSPSALMVNVWVGRWTHQLILQQSDGESFSLTKGSLQGSWSGYAQNLGWFTTSNYFDASTSYHPELDWWIYDATTGESSPLNQTDLAQWTSSADSDDSDLDGLPDWYEFILGTNPNNADSDGDGMPDGWELRYGLNPNNPNDAQLDKNGDGISNLAEFQNGTDPTNPDTDGDGIPNLWEVAHGMNPRDASDAAADWDGDGLSNLREYQIGTDPLLSDTDGDGIPDGWEIQHGLNPLDSADALTAFPGAGGLSYLQVYQGWAVITFQLPVSRIGHDFALYVDGMPSAPFTKTLVSPGVIDPTGQSPLSADSYYRVTFPTPNQASLDQWVRDNTDGEYSQKNTTDLRATPWALDQAYVSGGPMTVSNVRHFVLPLARAGHAFAVVLDNWYSYPVTKSDESSGDFLNASTGVFGQGNYGFVTATANVTGQYSQFYLVDVDQWEQAGASETWPTSGSWSPVYLSMALRSVAIRLPESSAGYAFTFHAASGYNGSLQGATPSWDANLSAYVISGVACIGETFWLTRDVDGASSPQIGMGLTDMSVDWSGAFQPVRNLLTTFFQVGPNRVGHTLVVVQPDGYQVPVTAGYGSGQLTTWNDSGQPVTVAYENHQAQIDASQTWWVEDRTTGENFGMTTALIDGWNLWHPQPPAGFVSLSIAQGRHGHVFKLYQDDGTTWVISPAAGYQNKEAYLPTWNTCFIGTPDERTSEIRYFPAIAPYDPAQGFTVIDETTGESVYFDGSAPLHDSHADLSGWYVAPLPLTLNITVTRWQHELVLHQANGDTFAINRGNLQGSWTLLLRQE